MSLFFSNGPCLEAAHHNSIYGESGLKGNRTVFTAESTTLVFDVGGSHVAAAAYRQSDCRLERVISAPHPAEASIDAFLSLLHALGIKALGGIHSVAEVILAVPGPFDHRAGKSLMRHKLPHLYGIDLRRAIADRFGWEQDQVCFLKDADACLLGEIQAGAARGFNRAVGFTLGTGIGSAFAIDGRIVTEGVDVPKDGEIWNLPHAGRTVEDFISTRAIQSLYQQHTGIRREVVELAADAPADKAAEEAFAEFGKHLGRVIDELLSSFAPDVVVLGGGISRSAHLFLSAVRREIHSPSLQLRVSELQDRAPLIGCGVLSFGGMANFSAAQSKTV